MDIEEQASASCQPSPKKQQDGFIKSFVCVVLGVLLVGFEVIFKCFRWLVACCVKGVRWVVGFYALRQQQEQEAARQQECNSRMEQTLERLEKQLAWMERNGRDEYLRLENHLLDALEKHERQHDVAFKALQTHLDWQNMALQEIEKALNTLKSC